MVSDMLAGSLLFHGYYHSFLLPHLAPFAKKIRNGCIFFELMTRYGTFLCYLCGRIRCYRCYRANDNGWQMSNSLNNTIMENIIALFFVLGEVALYIYLLIALCSYWIALSALSCLQSANSAMALALQLSQKFHVTKLTILTILTILTKFASIWSIWSCKKNYH